MAELTTNINFLQSTQFKVIIDRKKFGNLEFFAQSFQHPGVTVTSAPMAYKRIATVGLPGDTLTIDELGFEVVKLSADVTGQEKISNWTKEEWAASWKGDILSNDKKITLKRGDKTITRSLLDYETNKAMYDFRGFKQVQDTVKEIKEVKVQDEKVVPLKPKRKKRKKNESINLVKE